MVEWWDSLATLQQVFYYIAVPFTVVLLIQAVMTIIGLGNSGADADSDADFDADADTDFDADFDADIDADFDADIDANFDADIDADVDADVDTDIDADTDFDNNGALYTENFESAIMPGFRFFTARGIVAFFCIFGWTGAALFHSGLLTAWVVVFATFAGFLAMFVIGLIFYAVKNLQSSGNIKYSNAIGLEASVYIPIPPVRSGKGKVMVTVQERLIEADAMTDEKEKIPTGETVKIINTVGNTLIVKK